MNMSYSFWEVLFDNLNEGIYVLDSKGNYIYCNRAFMKMVGGVSREDILRLNTFNLVSDGQVTKSVGASAIEEKKRLSIINTVVTPAGYSYRQLATATPIFNNMGNIAYVLVETVLLSKLKERYQQAIMTEDSACVDQYRSLPIHPSSNIIAESAYMKLLLEMSDKLAPTESTILLTGETGTGKEVLAQYLHSHSLHAKQEMVEINCAALPENLLEAELFGYEKGAFTGAQRAKPGLVEKAQGSTLFLDEVNSLPLALQGKFLRVLETHKCKRLGALSERKLDFRLLCATNQDLKKLVAQGTFRADLYYRLSVVPLKIMPLRDRREDIIPLATYFLDHFCHQYGRTKIFTKGVFDCLTNYDWPGNVRELKNVVERLFITSTAGTLEIYQVPDNLISGEPSKPTNAIDTESPEFPNWEPLQHLSEEEFSLKNYLEECERQIISKALKKYKSTYKAAEYFKTNQSTIVRKKHKFNL